MKTYFIDDSMKATELTGSLKKRSDDAMKLAHKATDHVGSIFAIDDKFNVRPPIAVAYYRNDVRMKIRGYIRTSMVKHEALKLAAKLKEQLLK